MTQVVPQMAPQVSSDFSGDVEPFEVDIMHDIENREPSSVTISSGRPILSGDSDTTSLPHRHITSVITHTMLRSVASKMRSCRDVEILRSLNNDFYSCLKPPGKVHMKATESSYAYMMQRQGSIRTLKVCAMRTDVLYGLPALKRLRHLDLRQSCGDFDVAFLEHMPHLESLYVSGDVVRNFPRTSNPHLKKLGIVSQGGIDVPNIADVFENLVDFVCVCASITVPDTFAFSTKLKSLHVSCPIIPDDFVWSLSTSENIETLKIENSSMMYVPECISKLKNLKTVSFSNNKLTPFDSSGRLDDLMMTGLKGLEHLKSLNLSNNPDMFFNPGLLRDHQFPSLEVLDVSGSMVNAPHGSRICCDEFVFPVVRVLKCSFIPTVDEIRNFGNTLIEIQYCPPPITPCAAQPVVGLAKNMHWSHKDLFEEKVLFKQYHGVMCVSVASVIKFLTLVFFDSSFGVHDMLSLASYYEDR